MCCILHTQMLGTALHCPALLCSVFYSDITVPDASRPSPPIPAGEVAGVEDPSELASFVRSHTATDAEVRLLCKDLQVLGRSEFKQLLKWRLLVKKDLQREAAAAAKAKAEEDGEEAGSGEEGEKEDEDPEERLLREMGEIKDR